MQNKFNHINQRKMETVKYTISIEEIENSIRDERHRQMLFSPQRLVGAAAKVAGWSLIDKHTIEPTHGEFGIPMLDIAVEEAEEWTDQQDPDGDFGSSDMTFAIKGYLDHLIGASGQDEELVTVFKPSLSVITREEKKAHDMAALRRADVQLKEAGII